jgi:hypothetical protein
LLPTITNAPPPCGPLNEGRKLFPSDEQFGRWVAETVTSKLDKTVHPGEQQAAMWAAAYPEQFEEGRAPPEHPASRPKFGQVFSTV